MNHFLSRVWKLIKLIYVFLFALALIAAFTSKDPVSKILPVVLVIFGLPPLLIWWAAGTKAAFRNYLSRFADYPPDSLAEMSFHELKLRRELHRLDKSTDYRPVARSDLQSTIDQVKQDIKNNRLGVMGSLKAGFDSQGGTGNFYGTPGKRIVCINCGQRMMKSLVGWSNSVKCTQEGRNCVPHDATV